MINLYAPGHCFIDIHILQIVPPSCINRDDTGSPKIAFFGDSEQYSVRSRVSSQCWKAAMRKYFRQIFDDEQVGIRTKYILQPVARAIMENDPDMTEEDAMKRAEAVICLAGISLEDKNGKRAKSLFFISIPQAEALARAAAVIPQEMVDKITAESKKGESEEKGKKKKGRDSEKEKLQKLACDALKSSPAIDIALFGRMAASNPDLKVDAAVQVAHAISTHLTHLEQDYFSAVDDGAPDENTGAGHLGTNEFMSSVLYRYASVNVRELFDNIHDLTPDAVLGFVHAFIMSMPTGKINSYGNNTLPAMICVTVREDTPISFVGAFEKPVESDGEGFLKPSEKAFADYMAASDKVYGTPSKCYLAGICSDIEGAQRVTAEGLLTELEKDVREYIAKKGDE